MKLAVVGGGSTYTPELVAGLARERDRLDLRELVLQDIDPERREVVGGLAGRMLDAAGYEGELAVTDDLDRALDGASFVLIQLRVGGRAARLSDETIPLACGCIGQETTGAGGLGKALRTVPVVLEIADRARAGRRRRLDRRLHEPGRDRGARAARRGPSRGRPLQRRDRGAAASGPDARGRAGAGADRPGRAEPPHLGAGRLRRRRRCPAGAARRAGGRARLRLSGVAARAAWGDPVVLPALLL